MFSILDRWFRHRAAMDIMNMAVELTKDSIFASDKEEVAACIARIEATAESLAKAHVKVCTEFNKISITAPTDKEVAVIGKIFNHTS